MVLSIRLPKAVTPRSHFPQSTRGARFRTIYHNPESIRRNTWRTSSPIGGSESRSDEHFIYHRTAEPQQLSHLSFFQNRLNSFFKTYYKLLGSDLYFYKFISESNHISKGRITMNGISELSIGYLWVITASYYIAVDRKTSRLSSVQRDIPESSPSHLITNLVVYDFPIPSTWARISDRSLMWRAKCPLDTRLISG